MSEDTEQSRNEENEQGEIAQSASTPEPLGSDHYHRIEETLGYKFKDIRWLERALTHRSALSLGARSDYERLEFLGDAVFDLATAHMLSDRYPDAKEGDLSKMRAALVNASCLADVARSISLGNFIRLGRGEISTKGYERPSILADVVEALFGAVYRDGGYESAFQCVERLFREQVETVSPFDPKTELQELLHASNSAAPNYLLECVEGPEHAPTFVSVVEIGGKEMGRGKGPTKKASQQIAAKEALEKLRATKINDGIE